MKTTIRIGMAIVLLLFAELGGAEPAPLMTLLIKPGVMSEALGKGDVDVLISIPEMDTPAGAPLLQPSTMLPGLSKPQTIDTLTVMTGWARCRWNRKIRTEAGGGVPRAR